MEPHEAASIVRLGPRVPRPVGIMDSVLEIAVPSRIVERSPPSSGGGSGDSSSGSSTGDSTSSTTSSASSASSSCGANDCEKPVSSSTFTMPVILGVVIPVVGAAILFFILHRRHVRKQREEDANDRHASMDFGLGDVPQPGRSKRKTTAAMTELDMGGEKGHHESRRQRSMEFNMDSPYLLPPELQNSRESLHSLSRSLQHQHEDPYRPVTQYFPGDEKSIRSQSKQGSSIYTGSSAAPSRFQDVSTAELIPNAGGMPRSNPPNGFVPPPRQNSLPQSNASIATTDSQPPLPPYPSEPPKAHLPDPPQPEEIKRKGLPTSPRPGQQNLAPVSPAPGDARESFASNNDNAIRQSNNYLGALINDTDRSPTPPSKSPETTRKSPPAAINTLPSNPRPPRKESMRSNDSNQYGDGFKVTPPSPGRETKEEMMRGQRYSMDVPPEEFVQAGLGAPGFDAKRLSMGFRPLPPDAVTEMDDPEIRANRIRSFYKEYFDDSKPDPSGGQYYEDYDENYLGDAAYFDPETNAFVMPGAQPVHRRAMTPPPRGRFAGPPRAMHGSMGAMSATGPRGAPGPRAYSSASGRMGPQKMRKPMPPPSALNTLPTPSKLKDDTFALFNSLEFAPPQNYRDRAAGRSESPFGERRPYSPAVPAFTPVVSAFDELAPMPSPHLLRKSGTFTALDFAPPRKIKDADSMSDAGSIRSNRSGISQRQLGAIRGGAYRISRIPQDVVFTKDDLATTLKPQWGMRPGS